MICFFCVFWVFLAASLEMIIQNAWFRSHGKHLNNITSICPSAILSHKKSNNPQNKYECKLIWLVYSYSIWIHFSYLKLWKPYPDVYYHGRFLISKDNHITKVFFMLLHQHIFKMILNVKYTLWTSFHGYFQWNSCFVIKKNLIKNW